ncbi:MAG: cupredoxin family copper-binding protein [Anaerolineales bacterium]|nr:cupredoxin family copper-binding protein [Anaerolineales bacterium]
MKSTNRLIAISVLLMLLLVACSAPATPPEETPAETLEVEHTAAHTDAPAETEAQTEAEPDAPADESASITISNFSFRPGSLTVKAGTTVTWRNAEDSPHTVTADDGSFTSGTLSLGDSFSFTFDQPGTYDYYCEFHGGSGHTGMSGTIVVEE